MKILKKKIKEFTTESSEKEKSTVEPTAKQSALARSSLERTTL